MIPFTKMHGIGNDYVYINGFEQHIEEPAALARKISDRHFGVGGDGLILVLPPEKGVDAHVRMRMFNADGSESEMCGNGIRCVCKLAHDRGITKANPMRVQTGRGILTLAYSLEGNGKVERVTVDMGEPIWNAAEVPVRAGELDDLIEQLQSDPAANLLFASSKISGGAGTAGKGGFRQASAVMDRPIFKWLSMGNPHIVFFTSDVAAIPLNRWGPLIETHRAFPNRINAHFVQVHSRSEITMRTWERGSGITLACGTGASAVCAAGAALNVTDHQILAHLPGGDLDLRWDPKSNHIFMTGPATEVFSGEWNESSFNMP